MRGRRRAGSRGGRPLPRRRRATALLLLSGLALAAACRREPELEALTRGPLRDRMAAAARLARDPRVPDGKAIDLLSTALARELEEPTGGPPPEGAWFSAHELAAWGYASALATRGEDDPAGLKAAAEGARGALRSWFLVARGRAGDAAVAPALVPLLASPSPAIRAEAATLVGRLGERSAIPALRRLLDDPFAAAPASGRGRRYPVRQVAAEALRELGLEVRPTGAPGGFEVTGRAEAGEGRPSPPGGRERDRG